MAQFRRLDLAEDGLADAVEAAARTWPTSGVPGVPAAWLLTTARRRVVDRLRSEEVAARRLPELAVDRALTEEVERMDPAEWVHGEVADERLRLVLLCAHPSLAREHAAALTLRLVLGVPTEEIARLFLVPTPTMAARLTRARKRLADASFDVPTGAELEERVAVVGEVAYLAFTAGYAPGTGADVLRADVAAEAIRLVRVLRDALPSSYAGGSELDALLALMLLQHSRRHARVSGAGTLVLLPDQDRSLWDQPAIAEALAFATACDFIEDIGLDTIEAHERSLVSQLREELARIQGVRVFGPEDSLAIVSFELPGVHPHDLGTILDEENVAIRAGHHCCQPLMDHLGVPGTARASFGVYSDESDIAALMRGIDRTLKIFA